MPKVKISVIKMLNTNELFGKNPPVHAAEVSYAPVCPKLKEGQEFLADFTCPHGFCGVAFMDMQKEIEHVMLGGSYPWIKEKGVALSCCSDGMRPVIFKLERVEG